MPNLIGSDAPRAVSGASSGVMPPAEEDTHEEVRRHPPVNGE